MFEPPHAQGLPPTSEYRQCTHSGILRFLVGGLLQYFTHTDWRVEGAGNFSPARSEIHREISSWKFEIFPACDPHNNIQWEILYNLSFYSFYTLFIRNNSLIIRQGCLYNNNKNVSVIIEGIRHFGPILIYCSLYNKIQGFKVKKKIYIA